jgi:hypothetical protein
MIFFAIAKDSYTNEVLIGHLWILDAFIA